MAEPLVSVIIPTFNRCELLAEALDSVAAQTFGDYEIVVIDDGSTDQTEHMVNSRSEPIRYFRQHNQGVAAARNHALQQAGGSLVAFLDSDDLWEPRYLEACVALLEREPEMAMVYCDFISMDVAGRTISGHRKVQHGGYVLEQLFASIFIHTSCVTARRQIVLEAGGFNQDLPTNEDYDLWLRLAVQYPFGLVNEPLCRRRTHRRSLSRNGLPANLTLKAQLLENFYRRHGSEKISPTVAARRLAKVNYSAAKVLFKAGQFQQANQLLKRSLLHRPGQPKSWSFYLLSKALALVSPSRPQPDEPEA